MDDRRDRGHKRLRSHCLSLERPRPDRFVLAPSPAIALALTPPLRILVLTLVPQSPAIALVDSDVAMVDCNAEWAALAAMATTVPAPAPIQVCTHCSSLVGCFM
jgi:hypothetical protein